MECPAIAIIVRVVGLVSRGSRRVELIDKLSLQDESYATASLSPRMTRISRHVFVSPR